MDKTYKALVVNKEQDSFKIEIKQLPFTHLNEGEVRVKVHYSGLNYKDALACSENGKVIRHFPIVPGIDLAGEIVESRDDRYQIGDLVIATSYDIGVSINGGFAEYATVPANIVVPLPTGLTTKEAMLIGTAGFTAALSVYKLEQNRLKRRNEAVLVTGATGGVGSHAIAILSKLNYDVYACTRKNDYSTYLKNIGASHIVSLADVVQDKVKTLDVSLWDAAVDAVGGQVLASIISKLKYNGAVAVSGLTAGTQVETTVFPFILRGVNVLGIDSVYCPYEERVRIWQLLASDYKSPVVNAIETKSIKLEEVPLQVNNVLNGLHYGRILVEV